jgi:hypothetical protein
LIEMTQEYVAVSMHGDFASSNMGVRLMLNPLPSLGPEPSLIIRSTERDAWIVRAVVRR